VNNVPFAPPSVVEAFNKAANDILNEWQVKDLWHVSPQMSIDGQIQTRDDSSPSVMPRRLTPEDGYSLATNLLVIGHPLGELTLEFFSTLFISEFKINVDDLPILNEVYKILFSSTAAEHEGRLFLRYIGIADVANVYATLSATKIPLHHQSRSVTIDVLRSYATEYASTPAILPDLIDAILAFRAAIIENGFIATWPDALPRQEDAGSREPWRMRSLARQAPPSRLTTPPPPRTPLIKARVAAQSALDTMRERLRHPGTRAVGDGLSAAMSTLRLEGGHLSATPSIGRLLDVPLAAST